MSESHDAGCDCVSCCQIRENDRDRGEEAEFDLSMVAEEWFDALGPGRRRPSREGGRTYATRETPRAAALDERQRTERKPREVLLRAKWFVAGLTFGVFFSASVVAWLAP